MWKKLRRLFGERGPQAAQPQGAQASSPAVRWLPAEENSWGTPVVDLRPFALGTVSTSRDPHMATNAISYGSDDGTGFADAEPPSRRRTECTLRIPFDRALVDGALFQPRAMEDKWALYLHRGRILCIRSWLRELRVAADVRVEEGEAVIGPLHGVFTGEEEAPEVTQRSFEFLLRSHALAEAIPAPLFEPAGPALEGVALACFSLWGRSALFAAEGPLPPLSPEARLRTDSLFHIAVARGQRDEAERHLARGIPIDLLARDGLTALHWALASKDAGMAGWLLDRGCPVDARSIHGATPLMNAAQAARLDLLDLLLDRGADPNARDLRGFSALHRAAEMGHLEVVRRLLVRGADPSIEAGGHTALSLALHREHTAIADLLR